MEHTPIPWKVVKRVTSDCLGIDSTNGTVVATTGYSAKMEANAALIVRAVNNHAKLLTVLEGLIAQEETRLGAWRITDTQHLDHARAVIEEARK